MIHFVYLHYGPNENLRRELKYSLLTLRRHLDPAEHGVAIYTDAPDLFAAWPVIAVSIADKIAEYSRGGRYYHRIKSLVFRDAVSRFGDSVFLDSDSVVRDGFIADLSEKLRAGAVMNAEEKLNPWPQLVGFEAALPHAHYRYDPTRSRMYNSGLIGARADHAPAVADTVALLDALLEAPIPPHHVEQLAAAEAFRTHGIPIATVDTTFLHYWKRSWRRYADHRLPKLLPADWNDMSGPAGELAFNLLNVRLLSVWRSMKKRLPT